ncbi:hypothetical protein K435DRAFT_799903 [Dendrothele bispora CBS 962.96]|uniref:Uncharacterized protein n=1 Tax=Dendrothele bispora (strain CBS 962.96) TaxID=1314807 RepID=A0A4S8LUE3_DENBC|nr:hypothetical protein K435DRAFT_799903 [Dendrothele bispora CBS 962.96]
MSQQFELGDTNNMLESISCTLCLTGQPVVPVHNLLLPEFVEFYQQGQFSSGRQTPYFLIQRNQYDAEEGGANENNLLILDTMAPSVIQFGIQNWSLWAYVILRMVFLKLVV